MTPKKSTAFLPPIRVIEDISLETKVSELVSDPKLEGEMRAIALFSYEVIPEAMQDIPNRDLVYLAGEVCVLTTTPYLNSLSPDVSLASLFQDGNELFMPFNIEYLRREY